MVVKPTVGMLFPTAKALAAGRCKEREKKGRRRTDLVSFRALSLLSLIPDELFFPFSFHSPDPAKLKVELQFEPQPAEAAEAALTCA